MHTKQKKQKLNKYAVINCNYFAHHLYLDLLRDELPRIDARKSTPAESAITKLSEGHAHSNYRSKKLTIWPHRQGNM